MKAFKIKKRDRKQSIFIIDSPITSFKKPKIPRIFFSNIHKPTFFKPQSSFEVIEVDQDFESVPVLDFAGNFQVEYQQLSETVEKLVVISDL